MGHSEQFEKLVAKTGRADSKALRQILECALRDDEADFLLELPASNADLAERFGVDEELIASKMLDLARRGLVTPCAEGMCFPDLETLHDTILSSASTYLPAGMDEHWTALYEDEGWALELGTARAACGTPVRRTIPAHGSVSSGAELLPQESIVAIIEAHKGLISLRNCSCRTRAQQCLHPTEVCIQFGKSAEYDLFRGSGRKVSVDEAIAVATEAGKSGLIPTVANQPDIEALDFICFCCRCCCQTLDPATRVDAIDKILAPSRFLAKLDVEECDGCGKCRKLCSVGAIEMEEMIGFDEPMPSIDPRKCLGCGVCILRCSQEGAAMMEAVRSAV